MYAWISLKLLHPFQWEFVPNKIYVWIFFYFSCLKSISAPRYLFRLKLNRIDQNTLRWFSNLVARASGYKSHCRALPTKPTATYFHRLFIHSPPSLSLRARDHFVLLSLFWPLPTFFGIPRY